MECRKRRGGGEEHPQARLRHGPLARGQLPVEEEEVFKANRPRIDPTCERVLRQEYGRWAVVSRTMTYETCGLAGEIVQWGARSNDIQAARADQDRVAATSRVARSLRAIWRASAHAPSIAA